MTVVEVAGQDVALPVLVRDASAGTVLFEVAAGKTHLAIVVVDYRDNDLGAYHEVGIMLFARPRGGGADGTFILHLPVDQPFTCEAGQRIWGFPKTVERIDWDAQEGRATVTLHMDGELVLRLTLPRGGSEDMPQLPLTSYTLKGGAACATRFSQGGAGSQVVAGGEGVLLELGAHPVAKELAGLGLPGPAVLATWTERMQATFEEAVPLGG